MRNNKNGLDEMQQEQRNSIGNQMFILLFYSLMLNSGLYSMGIRWLEYPVNIMVITTICMGIYLVRVIALNAYLPPKAQNRKTVVTLVLTITFSILFTLSVMRYFEPSQITGSTNNNSALILMMVSAVGLVCVFITIGIKGKKDKADSDQG